MSALSSSQIAVARLVGRVARIRGSGGTSAPGRLLLRMSPGAVSSLAARLPDGCAVISATNGKTTTAAMTAGILSASGLRVVHNATGANMAGGVASTLLDAARGGGIDGDIGLFEVDEAWLDRLVGELSPRAIALSNLFRDQLDRYGELETLADAWAHAAAESAARLVLNADDPLVAYLGAGRPDALYFGIEDPDAAAPELGHAVDAAHCRRCGAPLVFDAVYLGHLGRYHCPACDLARPEPAVTASAIELHGVSGASFTLETEQGHERIELALPGVYNVYNALAAAALALALEVPLAAIAAGLREARPAFGRAERVQLESGRELRILLIKNPVGASEVARTLALEGDELELLVILNDRIADGRDVSWIWDADFELLTGHVSRVVCAGTRAADMAMRLQYAGMDVSAIEIVDDVAEALDAAVSTGDGTVFALPTYTAMLDLRALLAERGDVESQW